jgi:hypothetical protein
LLKVRHTAKTQAVEKRRKDIAMHQEFPVEPKAASCGGKLFFEPLFLLAMADIVKGIKQTCTILGYADDLGDSNQ